MQQIDINPWAVIGYMVLFGIVMFISWMWAEIAMAKGTYTAPVVNEFVAPYTFLTAMAYMAVLYQTRDWPVGYIILAAAAMLLISLGLTLAIAYTSYLKDVKREREEQRHRLEKGIE